MKHTYYLGVDWGGTYIKAGVVDDGGRLHQKKVFVSGDFRKSREFFLKIQECIREFSWYNIRGVGVGAPGLVDVAKGFIYYLPNVPGWENYPLKTALAKKLRLPVVVDNDANAFALAEARLGGGKNAQRVIFLTLGTGVGGAVVINGKLLEGAVSAGELGHVPVALKGKPCGCGGSGCIESFIGNKHLVAQYRRLKKNKTSVVSVKEIYQCARAGDADALRVWADFSAVLGKFLGGMINIFNPQVIVLGGGVSGAFSVFKPMLESAIGQQAMWPMRAHTRIVRAQLADAGIIGAGLLAVQGGVR